ncbi:hypothetical protein VPH35_028860 [Triticum aestivum]
MSPPLFSRSPWPPPLLRRVIGPLPPLSSVPAVAQTLAPFPLIPTVTASTTTRSARPKTGQRTPDGVEERPAIGKSSIFMDEILTAEDGAHGRSLEDVKWWRRWG